MNLSKLLNSFVIVLLIIPGFFTERGEASTLSSPSVGEVYDWIVDDQSGYIYSINMSNELLFLNKNTMKIDSKIVFSSDVLDVELFNGKLYVSTNNDLRVIDIATKKVVKTYPNGGMFEMAVDENRIYYITQVRYTPIYMLDLQTGKSAELDIRDADGRELFTHEPTITIDPIKDILYIAETNTSGGNVVAVRLTDNKIVNKSNYDNGRGFNNPSPVIKFDNGELFFTGYKMDGSNLRSILGQYLAPSGYENPVIGVYKNYVVTLEGVFNRYTYEFVTETPGIDVLIDSQNYMYIYMDNNTVVKQHISNYLDKEPNYQTSNDLIEFKYPITDFVTDYESGYIFAVSEKGNRLYYIRMSDMSVQHEIKIGSRPVDVNVMNGKVYVALFGATKVAVTNVPFNGTVGEIMVEQNPFQLEAFHNKLVYANNNQHTPVMMYDLNSKLSTDISSTIVSNPNMDIIYSPDLVYDKETNRLFVSETGVSGSNLFAADGTTLTNIQKDNFDNGYGFPGPAQNRLFVNNGELVIHRYVLNANDIQQVKGSVSLTTEEDIAGMTEDYFFSTTSVYSRKDFSKIVNFPYKIAAVKEVTETGELFVYSDEYQSLIKYSSADDALADIIIFGDDDGPEPPKALLSYQALDILNSFAAEDIYNFMQADLVKGYVESDGIVRVNPNDTITRAQFVAILVRALGLKDIEGAKEFQDVNSNAWYYPYVQKATAYGIVDGVSATQFAPGRNIRRDEIAKLVVRAFEKSIHFSGSSKPFSDVSKNHWSKPYIDKASSVGIISGFTETTFAPTLNATRAQAIAMLSRALKLEKTDLPTDEELIEHVITFEKTMVDLINQQNYTNTINFIQNETTGFYRHFNLYNIETIKHYSQKGITFNSTIEGDLKASVLQKTNHFAIVKLEGAQYKQTYSKGDFTYSFDQVTSGLLYLIKDDTGKWKIYRNDLEVY